jgi:hypothetical protein
MKSDDADTIRAELEKVYPAMKSLLDKKLAKEAEAQAAGPKSNDDNIVDAEFTETKN